MKKYLLMSVGLIFISGCTDSIAKYVANKAIDNISKIESFKGTVKETGLLENNEIVRTKVLYKKPDLFMAKITDPADFKGDTFLSDGKKIYIYYASSKLGIVFTGINPVIRDTAEKLNQRIHKNMRRGVMKNKVTWKGKDTIAGRNAHKFVAIPKKGTKYHYIEHFWSDAEFSFVLKVDMLKNDGKIAYAAEYEDISYNQEINNSEFQYSFPPGTTVVKWDLAGKNYDLTRIKKDMNFELMLPGTLSESMKIKKIVKAPGIIPAACLIYNDGLYYFLLTEISDYGLPGPKPRGILVPEIAENARLNILGESNIISWTKNGVNLTLTGNLPYYKMIELAISIE